MEPKQREIVFADIDPAVGPEYHVISVLLWSVQENANHHIIIKNLRFMLQGNDGFVNDSNNNHDY